MGLLARLIAAFRPPFPLLTPCEVRSLENRPPAVSASPGDTLVITLDQKLTGAQRESVRGEFEHLARRTGLTIVLLEQGMRPQVLSGKKPAPGEQAEKTEAACKCCRNNAHSDVASMLIKPAGKAVDDAT